MKLINEKGQPNLGHLQKPLTDANYADFAWRTAMGYPIPRFRRRLKCNQFQFVGLVSPDLIVGCAIVNLRLLANAFFYVYLPQTKQLREWSWLTPFAVGCHTPTQPDASCFRFRKGRNQVIMDASPETRSLTVHTKDGVHLHAHFHHPTGFEPVRVCTRAGYNGWVYTQKANALPATGTLQLDGHTFELEKHDVRAGYDWTIGFMRRHTFWNWASCSATLPDGSAFGFNLAAGVNETSYTENALWHEHQRVTLPPIQFHFDREQPIQPWLLTSGDGGFEATFTPQGLRRERIEAIILASNFRQVFGTFEGRFRNAAGVEHVFGPCYGFCEDHYARW